MVVVEADLSSKVKDILKTGGGLRAASLSRLYHLKKTMAKVNFIVAIATISTFGLIKSMDFSCLLWLDYGVIGTALLMWSVFGYLKWGKRNEHP